MITRQNEEDVDMATKKWTFLIKLFGEDSKTSQSALLGGFEAEGISPSRASAAASDDMDSERYDHIANAAALGDFVRRIGDKNSVLVKKLRDPLTSYFQTSKKDDLVFRAVSLYLTPLSKISAALNGQSRLSALEKNSIEWETLKKVHVTDIWSLNYTKNGAPTKQYDFVALKTDEVVKFQFEGADW